MGIKDFWQAGQVALSANRLADRAFYEQVAEEMRQGIRDEALWLMAYEKASGDEKSTQANYIGLRVQALRDESVIMGAVAESQARAGENKQTETDKSASSPPAGSNGGPDDVTDRALVVIVVVIACMAAVGILSSL